MKKKKENNLTLKILSLIIAIFLWSYVMGEVDPVISADFTVEVELKNLNSIVDENLILLSDKEQYVKIRVAGKKSDVDQLRIERIIAKADLKNVVTGKNNVPISISPINTTGNIRLVDYQPKELVLEVDEIVTEELNVSIETEGDIPEDYIIDDIKVEPEKIELTGPKSYINKINKILARVDVTDKTNSFNKSVAVELLDIDEEHIRGLDKKPSMINISVLISKKETVPIKLKTTGDLPVGYKLLNEKIEPETVDVLIAPNAGEIKYINTKPIDINSLIGKNSIDIELDIPEGVRLVDKNQSFKLNYDIDMEKNNKLSFSANELEFRNIPEGLAQENITIDENITIELNNNIDINNINRDEISLYVDLDGLNVGEHNVNINVEGISNNDIKGIYPGAVIVKID